MCGIAGIVCPRGERQSAALVSALGRILRHRGPDDHGWLLADAAGMHLGRGHPPERAAEVLLVHRRLSILDLSTAGWQPMGTADGRHVLVFNGEIYNFVELRAELEKLGHRFASSSDTEVLLRALIHWGKAALPRLVGMFAFAFLDRADRTLLLARDFFGIKPLYFVRPAGAFAFASEVKALLELPGVTRAVHPRRLYDYLTSGLTDHGGRTLFADVHQLPAAHCLELSLDDPGRGQPERYWHIRLEDRLDLSYDEAVRRTRELFLDNIRLHLRSDVPVGAALSGGIDSSAIVAGMRAVAPRLELHAFSYLADDPDLNEERWVRAAVHRSGAILHEIKPRPEELVDDLDQLVYHQDEPFGSTSIYAQHRVFRQAKEAGVTVMLDGQGADEMLAGYRPYLAARLATLVRGGHFAQAWRFFQQARRLPGTSSLRMLLQTGAPLAPAWCTRAAKEALGRPVYPRWLNGRWFERHGVQPDQARAAAAPDMLRQQLHRTLVETSLPMLLRYEDRNSMAFSIESRVPFLTPALADFLLRLPEDYLVGPDGSSKRVFRDAMRGLVPDEILDRRDKIGFATPERRWFTHLRPWLERTMTCDTAQMLTPLRHQEVLRDWHEVLAGKRPMDFRTWRCVNLIRWAERFEVDFA